MGNLINMGGLSREEARDSENLAHSEFTPMGRQVARLMANFLGWFPNLAEVVEARNKRARGDYWAYCRELFEEANIKGLFGSDGVVIPEIHWAGAKIAGTSSRSHFRHLCATESTTRTRLTGPLG